MASGSRGYQQAEHRSSGYQKGTYRETFNQQNVFYENEVKKDSEIKLCVRDVQHYLQNKDLPEHSMSDGGVQADVRTSEQDCNINASVSHENTNEKTRMIYPDRSHVCLICYKGFKNRPQLTQHELVHTNVRKHVCSYCEKAFKQICHLNQHIRVHTGERPYKCDREGCDKSFVQLSNLIHHKKNHDEHLRRDVSRQFRCEVCDRSYATKNSLNTHIQKLHTNIKCADGSVTSPITIIPPSKKHKRSTGEGDTSSSLNESGDQLIMECESDDDLLTQVNVKSSFELKSDVTIQTDTTSMEKSTTKTNVLAPYSSSHVPSFSLSSSQNLQGQHGSILSSLQDRISQDSGDDNDSEHLISSLSDRIIKDRSDNFISSLSRSLYQGQGHSDKFSKPDCRQNIVSTFCKRISDDTLSERVAHASLHQGHSDSLSSSSERLSQDQNDTASIQNFSQHQLINNRNQNSPRINSTISHVESDFMLCRSDSLFRQADMSSYSYPPSHIHINHESCSHHLHQLSPSGGVLLDAPLSVAMLDKPSRITHHFPQPDSQVNLGVRLQNLFIPSFLKHNQSIGQSRFGHNQ